MDQLTRRMLEADKFHVDGRTSPDVRAHAAELALCGWLRSFVGGDSQYTTVNYTVTDAGRAVLAES